MNPTTDHHSWQRPQPASPVPAELRELLNKPKETADAEA